MCKLKTIEETSNGELTEKKSKFISYLFYIESEEEVDIIINKLKKEHYNAKHYCYAYRLLEKKEVIGRYSDDGEPAGTAGKPIFTILEKNNIVNILVVVIRYFGGILLGTGGLVKAYSEATMLALDNSKYVNIEYGYNVSLCVDYQELEKIKYFCKINSIKIDKEIFTEKIDIFLDISASKLDLFVKFLENLNLYSKIEILSEKYIKC